MSSTAQTGTDIRPSTSAFRKWNWQSPSTHRGDALARSEDGRLPRITTGAVSKSASLLLEQRQGDGHHLHGAVATLAGASNRIDAIPIRPDCLLVDVIQDPDAVNGLIVRSWGERAFPHSVDNGWTSVVAKFLYLAGRRRAVLAGRSLDPARRRR